MDSSLEGLLPPTEAVYLFPHESGLDQVVEALAHQCQSGLHFSSPPERGKKEGIFEQPDGGAWPTTNPIKKSLTV